MKPPLASSVLRQASPMKHFRNKVNGSRFVPLRDQSVDSVSSQSTTRNRSVSVKRKRDNLQSGTPSYAFVAAKNIIQCESQETFDTLDTGIARVKSLTDKVSAALSGSQLEGILFSVLSDINSAICDLTSNQTMLVELLKGGKRDLSYQSKQPPKKVRQDKATQESRPQTEDETDMDEDEQDELGEDIKAFKSSVKTAEKSTLIFNLNLGKVPIMNTNTMLTKATKALTDMASSSSTSTDDTVACIDDILSMVKNVTIFGKQTKTYRHPSDKASGSYCTVPLRYEFKDKDTRVRAEMMLRDKCKVMCSTPYHPTLRESIKQVVSHFKKEYPENLIKVVVDSTNMCFRVSRKPKGELEWRRWDYTIPIPDAALDTRARKAPTSLVVNIPVVQRSSPAKGGSPGKGAGRQSRLDSPRLPSSNQSLNQNPLQSLGFGSFD